MRTRLTVLLIGLLLGGGALAGDDAATDLLDAGAKEALRQELLTAYRAQIDVNLAWDVVFTPGVGDESEPIRILVEAYADRTYVASRCASAMDDWSVDAVGTPDRLYMVKGDLAVRMPSAEALNEIWSRLGSVWKDIAPLLDVEVRPARVPEGPDAEPYRTAFGLVIDEGEDDSIDFRFNLVMEPGAEPAWLTEVLFEAKDVTGPTAGRVVLRSVRTEMEIDAATGMLHRARVTKQRTGSVMTLERAATTVTPEAWQANIQAVLARPVESYSQKLSHLWSALMAGGLGFWVACTTTEPEVQAARLREAVPKLVAAAFSGPDCLSTIKERIGAHPAGDEKAGITYLLASCWIADWDRLTQDIEAVGMLDDPTCLPDDLDVDAAWARTREAFRQAIRTYVAAQVDARWPRKEPQAPSAAGDR